MTDTGRNGPADDKEGDSEMRGLNTRRLFALAASFVLVLGIAACGDDDDDDGGGGGETSLDLTIGDSVPLTGDLSPFGPPGQKAADMAKGQIDAAIQEAGVDHTVNLVHEDNETSPQAAVQVARKLIQSDGASCLAGAWASADSLPTAQSVSIPEGVLQISPASTSSELTPLEDNGLFNRVPPADNLQGPVLAQAMSEELGGAEGKTINIGARNDAYGEAFVEALTQGFEQLGGTIGEAVLYDPEQPSFNSEAQQITSGNPDAFVIIDFPETFEKVGPALQRTGNWDANRTFITDGLASGDLFEALDPLMEGIRGTAPGTPEAGASSQAFDQLYQQSEPRNVDRNTFDAQNFDAVILCYLAAVAAGSTDGQEMADQLQDITGPGGTKYTWEQLPEAIQALQDGEDIDYVGAAGEIDLDDNGDPEKGVYDVFRVQNADTEGIRQVDVTEVEIIE
jgi:ABC-type branched-subunit amino acid transport system substrate-binding protein